MDFCNVTYDSAPSMSSLLFMLHMQDLLLNMLQLFGPQAFKSLFLVQRKAAHFVFSSFARNSSVTALLEKLNWSTLENKRNHAKVTMFYKIIIFNDSLPQSEVYSYLNGYHHSFLPSVIRMWNCLSQLKLLHEKH